MSSHVKQPADVQYLATYGTLRDDDDSGATWTNDFVKDISQAIPGRLVGYRIFSHSNFGYPFAVHTGDPSDSIAVRLLGWSSKEQFQEKLLAADIIEGDEYERRIVEVGVSDGARLAYVYAAKVETLADGWQVIPSGDWLQRPLKKRNEN